jgi:hypothetical protein
MIESNKLLSIKIASGFNLKGWNYPEKWELKHQQINRRRIAAEIEAYENIIYHLDIL